MIDKVAYAELRPTVSLHFGDLHIGGSVPLRFEVADTTDLNVIDPSTYKPMFANAGKFRKEDYDNILKLPYGDLLRPISFLTYGRKEDRFFVDITRMRSQSIGHGAILRRYTPNTDVDRSSLMAEVDAYTDAGGFEFVAGPLPIPRMVGGLVFVKPLGLFLDDYISKSLSFGVSYFVDLNAPTKLTKVANPLTPLNAKFPAIACEDPAPGTTEYTCGTDASLLFANSDALIGDKVQAVGATAEIKLVKWKFVDFKTYVDYSQLIFPGVPEDNIAPFSAGGGTLGGLLRMSFGSQLKNKGDDPFDPETERTARHAFRFVLEGRGFQPQFLPSYFNATYEIDRFQFGQVPNLQRGTLPTKIGYLATQAGEGFRLGYYAEASYQWVNFLAATVVLEDALAFGGQSGFSTVPEARNFALHVETAGKGRLQAFATYRYRNFSEIGKLFQLRSDNELLFIGGRLNLAIFSFNLGVRRSFRVGFTGSDKASPPYPTVDTDNDGVVDANYYQHSSVGYQNVWSGVFSVEVGWQF